MTPSAPWAGRRGGHSIKFSDGVVYSTVWMYSISDPRETQLLKIFSECVFANIQQNIVLEH